MAFHLNIHYIETRAFQLLRPIRSVMYYSSFILSLSTLHFSLTRPKLE
jgi:hypothetical protein